VKKFIVLALAVALLVPATVNAATEFSLGGFIKLNTFWDSTQNNRNLTAPVRRDNDPSFHHGQLFFGSSESRMNFTIKGPKVLGAVLTGFIEFDFDGTNATQPNAGVSNAAGMRLRHAMFRLNWPDTELLLGQYSSLFNTWSIDAAELSAFQMTGTATARLPQIRLTQKFLQDWTVFGFVGLPNNANLTNSNPYGNSNNGMAAETPQLQGSIRYAHDWWGKGAYFGHPRPFTVQVTAGWQRNINRRRATDGFVGAAGTNFGLETFGQNNYANIPVGSIVNQEFVNPWMVMGTLFIPVIPTHSPNLAGTAAILTQWFVGQGVEVFGVVGGSSNLYQFDYNSGGVNYYDVTLLKRFGGVISANYYFTNQWYTNVAYGISKCFGVNTSVGNPRGQDALSADQFKTMQEVNATLWYRPVQALKVGLQYSFANTNWFQKQTQGSNISDLGSEQRVQFVGLFFF
jgi:hypothetical protein